MNTKIGKLYQELIAAGEAPEWLTLEGFKMLFGSSMLEGETPRGMWRRVSKASAERLGKPEYEDKFFDLFWKNWLGAATPILSNLGTERGLPISCYSGYVPDSIDGIMSSAHELAMLSKNGGGVGLHLQDIRERGSIIGNQNGVTDGVVPFIKIFDSVAHGVAQGGIRRGAVAVYLPIEHGDFYEFLRVRKPQGDVNRQCLNVHHAVTIGNDFMEKVVSTDGEERKRWQELIRTRFEEGEPYIMFRDTVNDHRPEAYVKNNLYVNGSNLCSEITLYTDEEHTFVCCLSSLNLARWDEWKDTDAVYYATWFLDGVMQEFIDRAKHIPGLEKAVRFSEKSRALGLGAMGFHTYLQKNMIPMDSFEAYNTNNLMFKRIKEETRRASKDLAAEYGEPEWCKGTGMRNTHLTAIAPTATNSIVSGNLSAGIDPIVANAYVQKTSKGSFEIRNPQLKKILAKYDKDNLKTWMSITKEKGSVQHLDFLSEEEKAVFLTARELNMFTLIKLAAARQKHLDQTQSLNLFFPAHSSGRYINQVHLEAWKQGVQTLYYCRGESKLKGDSGLREHDRREIGITQDGGSSEPASYSREMSECTMCEG